MRCNWELWRVESSHHNYLYCSKTLQTNVLSFMGHSEWIVFHFEGKLYLDNTILGITLS